MDMGHSGRRVRDRRRREDCVQGRVKEHPLPRFPRQCLCLAHQNLLSRGSSKLCIGIGLNLVSAGCSSTLPLSVQ